MNYIMDNLVRRHQIHAYECLYVYVYVRADVGTLCYIYAYTHCVIYAYVGTCVYVHMLVMKQLFLRTSHVRLAVHNCRRHHRCVEAILKGDVDGKWRDWDKVVVRLKPIFEQVNV